MMIDDDDDKEKEDEVKSWWAQSVVVADWKVGRGLREQRPDWNDHASILATDGDQDDDDDGGDDDYDDDQDDDDDDDHHLHLHESPDDWALDSWQRSAGPFVNNPCWDSSLWPLAIMMMMMLMSCTF